MQLLDFEGLTVWYLNDTKSGWHPSTKDHLRGNNHPDDANRWLKYGKYKLWIKNNSTDKRAIQNILFGTARGTQFFEYDLKPGHEFTFDLNLMPLPDEYDFYKLNCNVK